MQKEISIKNAVDLAIDLIDEKQKEIDKGNITKEEAEEQIKTFLMGKKIKKITQEN